ncbi:MAG: (2Fe-2S)-binding protein [Anaeromyxobacter sp.]
MKICVCFNVSDGWIRAQAEAGQPLETVLRESRAGSACGTCRTAVAEVHAAALEGRHAAPPPPCLRAACASRAAQRSAA